MKKKMTRHQYETVMRRCYEAGYPACEVMQFGVCTGAADQWHHRKLRSQQGGNEASNGLGVCNACHRHIHDNTKKSYEKGWLVHGWHSPLEVPVHRRGQVVVLDDEGGYTPEMKEVSNE